MKDSIAQNEMKIMMKPAKDVQTHPPSGIKARCKASVLYSQMLVTNFSRSYCCYYRLRSDSNSSTTTTATHYISGML